MTAEGMLVVDDATTLIETFRSTANRIGIKGAEFFTSLADAWKATLGATYHRYIADHSFEGDSRTGIDFLEDVHNRQPEAELILLTGKYISPENKARITRIGASHIKKSQLDTDVLTLILSPTPLPDLGLAEGPEVDVAELRLQNDELVRRMEDVKALNDLLIEDIMAELKSIKKQDAPAMMVAGRLLSAAELRAEVTERSEIGRELIRLHHELYRHLRAKW